MDASTASSLERICPACEALPARRASFCAASSSGEISGRPRVGKALKISSDLTVLSRGAGFAGSGSVLTLIGNGMPFCPEIKPLSEPAGITPYSLPDGISTVNPSPLRVLPEAVFPPCGFGGGAGDVSINALSPSNVSDMINSLFCSAACATDNVAVDTGKNNCKKSNRYAVTLFVFE